MKQKKDFNSLYLFIIMQVLTGQTVVEDVLSLDADNNPVTATTFDVVVTKSGVVYSGVSVTMALADDSRGIFTASWSADTAGDYQVYLKNNVTNVIFITDVVSVVGDLGQNIYIGL